MAIGLAESLFLSSICSRLLQCHCFSNLAKGISSFNQSHFDELKYFVDCLVEDEVPSPTGLDGLRDWRQHPKHIRIGLFYSGKKLVLVPHG